MGVGIIRTHRAGFVAVCLSCQWPIPAVVPRRSHALTLLDDHHRHACTAPVVVTA
jgi:hypothetical protein